MSYKEQFVEFEIAVLLKQKGFDEPCLAYFKGNEELELCNGVTNTSLNSGIIVRVLHAAPLWQEVIDWLNNSHNIMIALDWYIEDGEPGEYIKEYHYRISEPNTWNECDIVVKSGFDSSYNARKDAIIEALKLI